jgi:hypothetical protein
MSSRPTTGAAGRGRRSAAGRGCEATADPDWKGDALRVGVEPVPSSGGQDREACARARRREGKFANVSGETVALIGSFATQRLLSWDKMSVEEVD